MEDEFMPVRISVNGTTHRLFVEPRRTLLDVIREDIGLTGTNVGCEHGSCGACTVLLDGISVRACLMLAVQANNHEVMTVEGLAHNGEMHPLQQAFWEKQGLQCGFCTPGFLMTAYELLQHNSNPSEEEIRYALSGNICRCTGYQHIVDAIRLAAQSMQEQAAATTPSGTTA
ncbi:MAG TPA: (2Fe-2S)-binding protein [Ktedonobacteraceae bacterium]|nr:(2Fe-2S)-binding protein [Ktedonobacteraceae bacterium]